MSHILLISHTFAPDGVSSAVLMGELACELKNAGHTLTVLTSTPHYNEEPEARARQPMRRCCFGLYYRSEHLGIPVYHAAVSTKGRQLGFRVLDILRFHIVSTLIGLVLVRHYDIMLVPSPPLTIGLSAWILKLFSRKPFIYTVQEIYPDVAVKLGVLTNLHLIRFFEWMELFIYRRAARVTVISERFRHILRQKGVSAEKVAVVPNFVDTRFIKPERRQNDFSSALQLDDQFVVLYAGNIGLTQSFETILAAMKRLADLQDITLLVVGDGTRRQWLEEQLAQGKHPNVQLHPYQPRSRVPQIYGTGDLCLVPLKKGTAKDTFPSKIYTIMAAGRPVIASSDPDSELTDLVTSANCGWHVPPDDAEALAQTIRYVYQNRDSARAKGLNGRHYVVTHFSRRAVTAKYDVHIRQLTEKGSARKLVAQQ